MKMSLRNLITSIALACSVIVLVAINAHAGGGKARVEAAKTKGMPVFVDFGRTTCTPCKMMVPVLDSLARKYKGKMDVVFVHVDEEREYALKMGVTIIPTQILLDKNGREVSRHVGYIPVEDCVKMINKTGTLARGKVCGPGNACK